MARGDAATRATPLAMHMVRMPDMVRWSSSAMFGAMVISALLMLFVPWQQTAVTTGNIMAYSPDERELDIIAPIKGRVAEWHVQEGEVVEAGQLLVALQDNDPEYVNRLTEQRDLTEARERAAHAAIEATRQKIESLDRVRALSLEAMDAKIRMARHEVTAANKSLKGTQGELKAAELNLARKTKLNADGLSSDRDLELGQAKATKLEAEVASKRAKLEEKRAKVLSLRAERESKAADVDSKLAESRAKLSSEESKLAKASEELSKANVKLAQQTAQEIVAPRGGLIQSIKSKARSPGAYIKAGDVLANLIPQTPSRAVDLRISGNDAPLVTPGRKVRLQFEGWPAVQFSGWPSVAVGTFGGEVAFVDAQSDKKGYFRVIVIPDKEDEPWPHPRFLRQGGRANGWIMLNEVSLGYELWRQVNGFPPTAPDDVAPTSGQVKK